MQQRTQFTRRRFMLLAGITGISSALAACSSSTTQSDALFVSTNGNDAWSGKLESPNLFGNDGPLASITRARDVIRDAVKAGQSVPKRVIVRGGRYELDAPLEFTVDDSASVTYAAYKGETPILDGGRRIPAADWRQTTQAGVEVWYADIPDAAAGKWEFNNSG